MQGYKNNRNDCFNIDGILGDRFMVNGKIQPFFQVHPRKYRFRWLNGGPTRFFEMFFTKTSDLSLKVPFWQISKPIQVESVRLGVAERVDVIVDFTKMAGQSFYLENHLKQVDGRGPVAPPDDIWPAGQGNNMMRIDVVLPKVMDRSGDPAKMNFYSLPNKTEAPRIIRTMKFDRLNGQWSMNGPFMDCAQDPPRIQVTQNSVEHWIISNLSGDWQHPIHIHFEEHQILSRNRLPPPITEIARKDVTRLQHNERVDLFFRFRDFLGRYPIHCHNLVHEDHAMMLRWDIVPFGDDQIVP